jgi:serine phosphatase RsbU (regulator of sigma subunit)
MKLQARINVFMLFMLALLGVPIVVAGYLIISEIVYDLNEKLLRHELAMITKNLEESQFTLEEAGVAGLDRYVKAAQKEALEKIGNRDFSKTAHVLIFDKQGRPLENPHGQEADVVFSRIVQPMLHAKQGKAKFAYESEDYFGVYGYFEPWDWLILAEIEERRIFTDRAVYLQFVLLTGVSVLVLVLLISYFFTRGTSLRIQNTLGALKKIEHGDMSVRLEAPDKDEIGAIQQGINAMAEKNAELYQSLEQKVEQRTAELAGANQEISLLNQRLQSENTRMSTELDITRRLQQMVLPKTHELHNIYDLDIAGYMEPADEVGGDYYDILNHAGRVKIGIGDVTGHGLESGVLMLMVQMAVRTLHLADIRDPAQFLQLLNRAVFDNVQRMETDKNLTLALLDYDGEHSKLGFIGQHEEVLVIRQGGQIERLDTIDLGYHVGLLKDISRFLQYQETKLCPGDSVVLYTDGITEAFNPDGEMYGVERLCAVLAQHWQCSAAQIQHAVIQDLSRHTSDRHVIDDITLVVIQKKPESAGAVVEPASEQR